MGPFTTAPAASAPAAPLPAPAAAAPDADAADSAVEMTAADAPVAAAAAAGPAPTLEELFRCVGLAEPFYGAPGASAVAAAARAAAVAAADCPADARDAVCATMAECLRAANSEAEVSVERWTDMQVTAEPYSTQSGPPLRPLSVRV